MNIVLALAALSPLAFANAWVSEGVLRSSAYESRQKLLQLALVWFLPLLGLGAVWALLREAENERCASERLTTDLADRGRSSIAVPDMSISTTTRRISVVLVDTDTSLAPPRRPVHGGLIR